ncbi:MAG: FtsW/RodA/SpoVE family cell cycle protein [Oscillospiraceae bacterium]|nr:FtsW/RodA/SpoVE family cell cycle protein [Oscillospiraceae bacterium]
MRRLWKGIREFTRRGDLLLLLLCVVTSVFGLVMVASTTHWSNSSRFVIVQGVALILGVLLYMLISVIDIEIFADHRVLLMVFSTVIMLMLRRWGIEVNGNRAWLSLPFLPVNIQPAEICKITFIIILAKILSDRRAHISAPKTVGSATALTLYFVGLIIVLSHDAGSAMVFLFIFLIVAYVSGIRGWWFLIGLVAAALLLPLAWKYFIQDYQKQRILMLFDPSIDPTGEGVRWDTNRSIAMVSGGGVSGQGLFHGLMTQSHAVDSQYSDFIFSAIGEELGNLGCLFTILLLVSVIVRVLHVGLHTPNFMNRSICFGIAAMMTFQMLTNIGMCIGVFPVIGLTLPFVSYGGSSLITTFLSMGLVSGIHMRPDPDAKSPYIQPRL